MYVFFTIDGEKFSLRVGLRSHKLLLYRTDKGSLGSGGFNFLLSTIGVLIFVPKTTRWHPGNVTEKSLLREGRREVMRGKGRTAMRLMKMTMTHHQPDLLEVLGKVGRLRC